MKNDIEHLLRGLRRQGLGGHFVARLTERRLGTSLTTLPRMVTQGPAPAPHKHLWEERSRCCRASRDRLAELQEDVARIMNGIWQCFAIATEIVIGTVSALIEQSQYQHR